MSQTELTIRPTARAVGLIGRTRKNHALEHATMHILADSLRARNLMGRATPRGFHIYGDVPTAAVLDAARRALRRLNAGERQLAVHPNCGTNLVLAGTLAGAGSFLVLVGRSKSWWERILLLPFACAVATLGIILARPLGPLVQARVSTDSNVSALRITGVSGARRAGITDHFVRVEG